MLLSDKMIQPPNLVKNFFAESFSIDADGRMSIKADADAGWFDDSAIVGFYGD